MKENKLLKQWIVAALCLTMLIQHAPVSACALTGEVQCGHHPEHTEECGYVQTQEDSYCAFRCEICNAAPAEDAPENNDEATAPDMETQPTEAAALSPAATEETTAVGGTCGDNLTWTLDDAGNLTISGTGAMDDWTFDNHVPWYENREIVKTVVVEAGVTSIGESAFYHCTSLTGITLPAGLTSIGDDAFVGCKKLTGVDIPDSVTEIGNTAFIGCNMLARLDLPAGLTSIGDAAFAGCTALTSVDIPDSVTEIGNEVFSSCSMLTRVDLPAGLTSIG